MWSDGSKMFWLVTKALWITLCIPEIFVLCFVNHTKVTINIVACRLSPNSRYSKWHTLSSPTQPSSKVDRQLPQQTWGAQYFSRSPTGLRSMLCTLCRTSSQAQCYVSPALGSYRNHKHNQNNRL
jgi:hypothetical protein